MSRKLIPLLVVALSLLFSGRALAADMEMCATPTIPALQMCVAHATEMGAIDNSGVAQSLVAKLDAAQAALDRGQPAVAINNLNALIQEVRAQSGQHIEAEHATHLITHTQHVIDALSGP